MIGLGERQAKVRHIETVHAAGADRADLADEGIYLASESSFQRVLRAHGQTRHRGRARAPQRSRTRSCVRQKIVVEK